MSITINDLICMLEDAAQQSPEGEDTEVRFASQPSWPFEYSISTAVTLPEGEEGMCPSCEGEGCAECGGSGMNFDAPHVVWLAEGRQLAYLPGHVKMELGW